MYDIIWMAMYFHKFGFQVIFFNESETLIFLVSRWLGTHRRHKTGASFSERQINDLKRR